MYGRLRRISLANAGRRYSASPSRKINSIRSSITPRTFRTARPSRIYSHATEIISTEEGTENPFIPHVEIKEEPTEIPEKAPDQIYPNPKGRHIWTDLDWIVTSLGFTFNVTSILRFPFLCARYGGGAFICMYLIMTLILAVPCCFMESILGQFSRTSSLTVWKIAPLFKGLGFCFLVMNLLTPLFNQTMTTWSITYLLSVFSSVFGDGQDYAWSTCTNEWNSEECIPFNSIRRIGPSDHDSNSEYFRGFILGQTDLTKEYGLLDVHFESGIVQSAATLGGVTLFVFMSAILIGAKGLPRLSILLFGFASSFIWLLVTRTISLPGALDGVHYFLHPDWSQLGTFVAWLEAARFVFANCGLGLGIHLTHASFNDFKDPILLNMLIPIGISSLYSIFSAMTIFSLFGFSAQINGRSLSNLTKIGPEFVFEFIPIALDYDLSFPTHFYFAVFFIIIFLTSLLGSTVRIINFRLAVQDFYQSLPERKDRTKVIVGLLMLISYLLTLPLISTAAQSWIGVYQMSIYNIALPFLILMEMGAICWIWGTQALDEAHIRMTDGQVLLPFTILWKILSPITVLVILISGISGPNSIVADGNLELPPWASWMGLYLLTLLLLIIITFAIVTILKYKEQIPLQLKFLVMISPDYESGLIESTGDGTRAHWAHYKSFGSALLLLTPTSSSDAPTGEEGPKDPPEVTIPSNENLPGGPVEEAVVSLGSDLRGAADLKRPVEEDPPKDKPSKFMDFAQVTKGMFTFGKPKSPVPKP